MHQLLLLLSLLQAWLSWSLTVAVFASNDRQEGVLAAPRYHSYWTAYINVSHLDLETQILHTERTETGRYSNHVIR